MKNGSRLTFSGADIRSAGERAWNFSRTPAAKQLGRFKGRLGIVLVTFLVGCVGYVEGGYGGGYRGGWWGGPVYEPRVDVHVFSARGSSSRGAAHGDHDGGRRH